MEEKLEQIMKLLKTVLATFCPYDTGNLKNSIRETSAEKPTIIIGGNETAPYVKYTNEPWAKGNNPNEGWIEDAIQTAIPYIKSIIGNTMTQEQYNKLIGAYTQKYNEQLNEIEKKKQAKLDRLEGR